MALPAVFPYLTALQHLNLGINEIGPDGAASLSAVLPHLTALQHLDLGRNDITNSECIMPSVYKVSR